MGKVAYLINQYPKVSHSFIRREIAGIEACGIQVERFSIRACSAELIDEADKQELLRTHIILQAGFIDFLSALAQTAVTKPLKLLQALGLVMKLGWKSERGILLHFVYLAEACVLLQRFSSLDITHVHAHFGTNSTTVALLCYVLGGPPYSFTVHGPEEFDKVAAIALPEKIKRAAFVVAVSSFGKSQLYRWSSPEDWIKIHVVHCGVDQEFLAQQFTPIPSEPRFVCVGRLCEQKGQLLLLEAASQLIAKGLEFKLVLVGDGPLRPEIEKAIIQRGLENHVQLTGWASSDQVREHILASRALVLPSFAEGLPVVIMEAMTLGRPVISTYVAGIPELVESGVNGQLVHPGSIDALVKAMRTILELPIQTVEAMGRVGAERVSEQHNVAIEAKKLVSLFQASFTPEVLVAKD